MLLKKVNFIWAAMFCLISSLSVAAQSIQLSNTVRDLNTHRELSGVNIVIKGTHFGTSTDYSGRFILRSPVASPEMIVVFSHIAYQPLEMTVDDVRSAKNVYLQPRVIPLQGVEIEGKGPEAMEIRKDLPQTVSAIEAKKFEIRGYTDAGDLLRLDHSIQVEEELSGKKTISIRGGNSNDVIVLFNGVKLNNTYDNIFDLSLIDLEDIERIEIIKGSNTSLYGPEALSGIVNIVPKMQQNYNIRFQQRLGTYRSGNWGLHLYHKFNRLQTGYSYKRGGWQRKFVDIVDDNNRLVNNALHQTGTINYHFPGNGDSSNLLHLIWMKTSLDYNSQRPQEQVTNENKNQMFSLKFSGDLHKLRNLNLNVSYRKLEEAQLFASGNQTIDRFIKDRSISINAGKQLRIKDVDLLFAYQFEDISLDFLNDLALSSVQPIGLRSALLERHHHGFVSILKYHGSTGSDFWNTFNIETSLRHDRVADSQQSADLYGDPVQDQLGNIVGFFGKNNWQDTIFKLGVRLNGYRQNITFNSFLNFGSNVKFPSLFQQTNSLAFFTGAATQPDLDPERSRSFELGATLTRDLKGESSLYGLQVGAIFFQTYYDNKIREFTIPGTSVVFYDNSPNARISGVESKASLFLLRKKVTIDLGISRYFISEKTAFPFKSDLKQTISLNIDHGGYSFQLFWFNESKQTALLRQQNNTFISITLPDYTNLDLHLSKTVEFKRFKLFANTSIRNLLNDNDVDLSGLSIRDRRFYLTMGVQY